MSHPTDNLVRLRYDVDAVELRDDSGSADGSGRTMFGHFAVFDSWTEINSIFEGRFLERIRPGAFRETFRERANQIRVLYDPGHDPSIGNKPLGAPDVLREDKRGAYYESELFDSSYVDELLPALRAGQLGASFRFRVSGEEWNEPKRANERNPDKLPERSITSIDLFEFGPVTFPAYADASAGVRSVTDDFLQHFEDPMFVARFTERAGLLVTEKVLASLPPNGRPDAVRNDVPADGGSESDDEARAQARALIRARRALLATV